MINRHSAVIPIGASVSFISRYYYYTKLLLVTS
nr:MAG TPA: hypothetical protein [Caudoviricetes sp.]DAV97259.1 MAG TPA: hypothetical protein [Bacteriophage sp.]